MLIYTTIESDSGELKLSYFPDWGISGLSIGKDFWDNEVWLKNELYPKLIAFVFRQEPHGIEEIEGKEMELFEMFTAAQALGWFNLTK